ncbi:MAG TPA: hypothetical protein VLM85_01135 [Polyangiaceae bacterium]|nr:hypothetical protein [Polyangiaceae bacterium]
MQSSVKPGGVEVVRFRRCALALGLVVASAGGIATSCKSAPNPAENLVAAPMLPPDELVAEADDAGDAATDGSATARSMPEPRPPSGMIACTRDVRCEDPLSVVPVWPYPQPFERCDPERASDAGVFSAKETTERRQDEPDTCCYVSYRDCSRRGRR